MNLDLNPALIAGLSQFFYIVTIPWAGYVWWKVFQSRRYHPRIMTLSVVQSIAFPLYGTFAVFFVMGFSHALWVQLNLFAWAFVNVLFITTDLMMANTIALRQLLYGNIDQLKSASGDAVKAVIREYDDVPPGLENDIMRAVDRAITDYSHVPERSKESTLSSLKRTQDQLQKRITSLQSMKVGGT